MAPAIRYNLEWLDSGQPRRDLAVGRYLIGRGGGSDIVIEATGVSREHAELLVCADGGLLLRDLDSTNGTRVDGQRIRELACRGDLDIDVGSARLRLRERLPGLDGLAFAMPGADLFAPPDADAHPASDPATLLRDLRTRLIEDLARARPPASHPEAWLSLLLEQWRQTLNMQQLRVEDARGSVLLQAGAAGADTNVQHASVGPWRLCGDPVAGVEAAVLAELGGELLRWTLPARTADSAAPVAATLSGPGLPSANPAMRELLAQLARAARAPIPVLLLGETGVGKELLARWVHQHSPRGDGPFLAINCAALPRDLLEAELFGVERGAATGVEARPGLFERADGGTLFLDEVGDMGADTQVRLLRVLEEAQVSRLGARRSVAVDVRIVAATNRDLAQETGSGRFRLDLYHRLAGYTCRIPPLRERSEDIAPLAIHFFQQALTRAGQRSPGITSAALLALQRWRWPGNVRELRQAIEHAVVLLHEGEALDRQHLPEALRAETLDAADLRLEQALLRAEREALVTALALSGGQHERAWQLLDIGKTSFYKKLKEHGLGREGG